MQIKIRSSKDFYSGLIFIGFGLATVWLARTYPMGSAQRMGPGYFPTILGGLLGVLGFIILIESLTVDGPPVTGFAIKPLLLVLGAVTAFALLVQPAGLVAAIIVLIFVSALGGHEFRFKEVLLTALVLAAASVGIFVYGLQLQFNVWPW